MNESAAQSRPSIALKILQVVLFLHAFGVLAQSIFAGQFLSGIEAPVVFHELNAWFILALSILQVMFSLWVTRFRGPGIWFVMTSVLIFLAEGLQIGTGYGRFLGVHIPLGVLVFGTLIWQLDLVFRRRSLIGDVPA